ncbi:hypothetical protein LINPERHAP1_LOCUS27563 [Linum perenne]
MDGRLSLINRRVWYRHWTISSLTLNIESVPAMYSQIGN